VARLTKTIKRKAADLALLTSIDANQALTGFSLKVNGWLAQREFFGILGARTRKPV